MNTPMSKFTAALLVALILAAAMPAQGPVPKPTQYGFTGEWGPALIPTTGTAICIAQQSDNCTTTKTFWITKLTLTNQANAADTCYLQDKEGTPVGFLGLAAAPVTIAASTTYVIVSPGEKMVGGATWACTAGTVSARLQYGY